MCGCVRCYKVRDLIVWVLDGLVRGIVERRRHVWLGSDSEAMHGIANRHTRNFDAIQIARADTQFLREAERAVGGEPA